MKKLLSVLAFATALAGVVTPAMAASDFPDVPSSSPYYTYIQALHNNSVVGGYPDGTFGPQKTLTRAEFCRFVVSAFDLTQTQVSTPFTDISSNWGKSYIVAAYATGLIAGVTPTAFAPDDKITREQAASIVWRYLSAHGLSATSTNFAVSGSVDDWATEGIQNIIANNLYGPEVTQSADGGYDFRATTDMTRQEMAALIDLSMVKQGLITSTPTTPQTPFSQHAGSFTHPIVPQVGLSIDFLWQGKPSRRTTVVKILNQTSDPSNLILDTATPTYKFGNIPILKVENTDGNPADDAPMAEFTSIVNAGGNLMSQVTFTYDGGGNLTFLLPSTAGTGLMFKAGDRPYDTKVTINQMDAPNALTVLYVDRDTQPDSLVNPSGWFTIRNVGTSQAPQFSAVYSTIDIN